ncbi:MAG: outer membrane lipoprotein chaperone LolA [Rhodocyclaceae bacterium]|nr:outer membrane lipoprotein chaperone LolA [Rhodocyclaceae bacterium]
MRTRPAPLRPFLFALAALALATPSQADGIQQLRQFLQHAQQGSGHFEQVVYAPTGTATERSHGQFSFARPDRFRWHYEQPYEQLLISDGQTFWSWDPELKQATRQKSSIGLSATPAAILSGENALDAHFTLENQPDADGLEWVRARPKEAGGTFTEVRIGLRANRIERMSIVDNFEQRTELKLLDTRLGQPLPSSLFHFTPPAGADIIDAAPPAPAGNG